MVMHRVAKSLSYLIHTFPADVKPSDSVFLPSCFSSNTINKDSFVICLVTRFPHLSGLGFVCICVCVCVILLFKMVPQNNTKVVSDVLKCKKVLMCLMEKIPVIDKLPSNIHYSVVGY